MRNITKSVPLSYDEGSESNDRIRECENPYGSWMTPQRTCSREVVDIRSGSFNDMKDVGLFSPSVALESPSTSVRFVDLTAIQKSFLNQSSQEDGYSLQQLREMYQEERFNIVEGFENYDDQHFESFWAGQRVTMSDLEDQGYPNQSDVSNHSHFSPTADRKILKSAVPTKGGRSVHGSCCRKFSFLLLLVSLTALAGAGVYYAHSFPRFGKDNSSDFSGDDSSGIKNPDDNGVHSNNTSGTKMQTSSFASQMKVPSASAGWGVDEDDDTGNQNNSMEGMQQELPKCKDQNFAFEAPAATNSTTVLHFRNCEWLRTQDTVSITTFCTDNFRPYNENCVDTCYGKSHDAKRNDQSVGVNICHKL